MEQPNLKAGSGRTKIGQSIPPAPPPLPPLPRFWARKAVAERVSVTRQEIAKFWRQKLIAEEDHLLAAIKAAARIRARNLSEDDYMQFQASLKDDEDTKETRTISTDNSNKAEMKKEVFVGIKDWWTKSKYAYLNQPATETQDGPKRRTSSYTPNCFSFDPTPLYPTSLGVF